VIATAPISIPTSVAVGLVVAGTAVTTATVVQSARHRDLLNNPISEEQAHFQMGTAIGGLVTAPFSGPTSAGMSGGRALVTTTGMTMTTAVAVTPVMVEAAAGGTAIALPMLMSVGNGSGGSGDSGSGDRRSSASSSSGRQSSRQSRTQQPRENQQPSRPTNRQPPEEPPQNPQPQRPVTPAQRLPSAEVAQTLSKEGSLTELANQVKGLGQGRGATVEIALARTRDGKEILVAGINSGSKGLNAAQLRQLEEWGVNVAPEIAKGMKGAPHAEENIAAYLHSIGARGVRWSRAVVGELKPSGSSYVCQACQSVIRSIGGRVEHTH
jgi:hypothetical protein